MRSSGVPHVRQITAWQSPQTSGSATGLRTIRAVKLGGFHAVTVERYFAASILSTLMFLPLVQRAGHVTFLAANFAGVF